MTKNMTAAFRKYTPQVQVHVYLHKNLCSEQNNREKYTDSFALDGTSRRLGQIGIYAYYQPTLNNFYGRALSKAYRWMVDEFDANIYMDEICLSVTAWEHYSEWDQCTAIINPVTHEVTGTISIPNLLVRPWLDEMLGVHSRIIVKQHFFKKSLLGFFGWLKFCQNMLLIVNGGNSQKLAIALVS